MKQILLTVVGLIFTIGGFAQMLDKLGMAEYEAVEMFVKY